MDRDEMIEYLCEKMHDAYEAAAVGAGWETQEASRKPWSGVPEANKATMRAAVSAIVGIELPVDGRRHDVPVFRQVCATPKEA